jgi:flagella basal body P-ring formation protein FlgA
MTKLRRRVRRRVRSTSYEVRRRKTNFVRLFTFFISILVLVFVARGASAAPNPVPTSAIEVQLNGDVNVAAEQIVLGDVATIYAKDLADFKALSGLVLSRIPDDKREVRLPSSYLEARIRAALPAGSDVALRAPREILFRLQRLGISAQEFSTEVQRMARAAGKAPADAELEVETLTGMDQLKGLTLAAVRIEPQAEMEQWKGDLGFKITRTDAPASTPLWVRARVRWFRPAWVAVRQLGFNEQPSPALFAEGRVETTGLREEPVHGSREELASALQGTKLRRSMAVNAPLLPSVLEHRPDAQSGAALRVVFVSESGVRVSADGMLVGPGSIGGDVKARLKSSKKLVTGKLVSQGQVEVSL